MREVFCGSGFHTEVRNYSITFPIVQAIFKQTYETTSSYEETKKEPTQKHTRMRRSYTFTESEQRPCREFEVDQTPGFKIPKGNDKSRTQNKLNL